MYLGPLNIDLIHHFQDDPLSLSLSLFLPTFLDQPQSFPSIRNQNHNSTSQTKAPLLKPETCSSSVDLPYIHHKTLHTYLATLVHHDLDLDEDPSTISHNQQTRDRQQDPRWPGESQSLKPLLPFSGKQPLFPPPYPLPSAPQQLHHPSHPSSFTLTSHLVHSCPASTPQARNVPG